MEARVRRARQSQRHRRAPVPAGPGGEELPRGPQLEPASVLQVHRILSRALEVAVQRGRAARDPRCSSSRRVPKRKPRPMRRADARAVLRAVRGRRNAACCVVNRL
jgi:hypothetical protein